MSLINDTLRDLDERNGTRVLNDLAINDVAVVEKNRVRHLKGLVVVLSVSLICVLAYAIVSAQKDTGVVNTPVRVELSSGEGGASVLAATSAAPEVSPHIYSESAQKLKTEASVDSEFMTLAAESGKALSSDQPIVPSNLGEDVANSNVDLLLRLANTALMDGRLTLPKDDNALYYFNRAKTLAPNNELARVGIERVKQTYLKIVDRAILNSNIEKAQRLLHRAGLVGLSELDVANYYRRLDKQKAQELKTTLDEPDISANIRSDSKSPSVYQENKFSNANNPHSKVLTGAEKINSSMSSSSLSITRTAEFSEKAILDSVNTHIVRREYGDAETQLVSYLKEFPNAVKAKIVLFELYVKQNKMAQAESFRAAMVETSPVIASYFSARMLIAAGQVETGFELLKNLPLPDFSVPSVLAFRAALAQQLGENKIALADYTLLVEAEPENVTYWLGHAVVCDAMGEALEAIHSFVSVTKLGGLPENVMQYVGERINTLSAQNSKGAEKW